MIPLALLISCGTSISYPDVFYKISKDISQSDFQNNYQSYIDDTMTINIENYSYKIFYAKMETFKHESITIEWKEVQKHDGQIKQVPVGKHEIITFTDKYIFIFLNNNYFYSGFLYELLRHKNQQIREIGLALIK